ncbi:MAG: S41 family peptidase [Anaerolineae bacterium]
MQRLGFGLACVVVVGSGFFGGSWFAWGHSAPWEAAVRNDSLGPAPAAASLEETFPVFWEAWRVVDEEFFGGPVSATDLTRGAIRGALATLGDPHTAFVPPSHRTLLDENLTGSFEGIGAAVELNERGELVILDVLPGAPSARAGIRAGDLVVEVDDESIVGLDIVAIVGRIRGPEGTPVTLTVHRSGVEDPIRVDILRERVQLITAEHELVSPGIGYLSIKEFNARAPEAVAAAIRALEASALDGLVLDLRDNPGGLVTSVREVGSQFIGEGLLFTQAGRGDEDREYLSSGDGLATEIPIVVLMNGGSASGSEILAGALRDHRRGILIGTQTFGKGSVQELRELSDGSGLRVTVAHWFTPDGLGIQGEGLTPDIEVRVTDTELAAGLDPQLALAIDYLQDLA